MRLDLRGIGALGGALTLGAIIGASTVPTGVADTSAGKGGSVTPPSPTRCRICQGR